VVVKTGSEVNLNIIPLCPFLFYRIYIPVKIRKSRKIQLFYRGYLLGVRSYNTTWK